MKTVRVGIVSTLVVLVVGCGPKFNANLVVDSPLAEGTVGAIFQLRASMKSQSGGRLDLTSEVTWQVTDASIASIDSEGKLKLLAPGEVSIIVSHQNEVASTTVKVKPSPVMSISLVPGLGTLPIGANQQFLLLATFKDGTQRDVTHAATWSFEGGLTPSGARGNANAIWAGEASVRASFEMHHTELILTVTSAAQVYYRIALPPELRVGELARPQLIGAFADGSSRDISNDARWTSSNPAVAQIVINDGVFLNVLNGGFTLLSAVSPDGTTISTPVMITSNKAVAAVEFGAAKLQLASGVVKQLEVFARFQDGERVRLDVNASYSTTSPDVVAVDARGTATALKPGVSTVWVTFGGVTATLPVEVTAASLVGLSTSVQQLRLAIGQTAQVAVLGHYSDGTTADLTSVATVSSTGNASVKPGGTVLFAIGEAVGLDRMVVRAAGLETVVAIEVSREKLIGLQLDLVTSSPGVGHVVATARWEDGLQLDVSEQVQWTLKGAGVISNLAGARGTIFFAPQTEIAILASLGDASAVLTVTP